MVKCCLGFTATGGYTCMITQYFDSVAAIQATNNETGELCGEVLCKI